MLNVYAVEWCPHCRKTIGFLEASGVGFAYHDMEKQTPEVEAEVIKVNGGDDWVVPTLEYGGKWRPGKVFNEAELRRDLADWGLL